jgi:hypothetical protein
MFASGAPPICFASKTPSTTLGLSTACRRRPSVSPTTAIRFAHDAGTLDSFEHLYLQTRLGPLDCLGSVLGVGDFEAAVEVSMPIQLGEQTIRVLTFDALIAAKSALGRDRDREAVKHLEEIKRRQGP